MRTVILSVLVAVPIAGAAGCKRDDAGRTAPKADPTSAPASQLLAPGAELPAIDTVAHDGTALRSSELEGAPLVVYFYPKDETSGCNAEAEAFRDAQPEMQKLGARLVGVSTDSIASHKEFAAGHQLNFPLIADEDMEVAKAFGVPTDDGTADRVTFVFGPDGVLARVFADVSVDGHAAEVLAAVKATKPAP